MARIGGTADLVHARSGGTVDLVQLNMGESLSEHLLQSIQLRFLCAADIPEVKGLCAQWFPIE